MGPVAGPGEGSFPSGGRNTWRVSYELALFLLAFCAAQRAFTASRASLLRTFGGVFLARAWPPSRPLATAAGSFSRLEACPVAWATTSASLMLAPLTFLFTWLPMRQTLLRSVGLKRSFE